MNSLTLDNEVDSVECCPFHAFDNICAVGTYHLVSSTSRVGTIELYQTDGKSINKVSDIKSSGILDLKWNSQILYEKMLLIASKSDGISLNSLEHDVNEIFLKQLHFFPTDSMSLSIDWNKCNNNEFISSYSDGSIALFHIDSDCNISRNIDWKAHDYEAWVCSYDQFSPNIVYTGSDDCLMKVWDTRCLSSCVMCVEHQAGVTSIQSNLHTNNLLASGSYDEMIRLWDTRNLKLPISSIKLGGGIWRIKWHYNKKYKDIILSACMHGHFNILKLDSSPKLLFKYDKHSSLAYGVDWIRSTKTILDKSIDLEYPHNSIISGSFYDKQLHLWNPEFH